VVAVHEHRQRAAIEERQRFAELAFAHEPRGGAGDVLRQRLGRHREPEQRIGRPVPVRVVGQESGQVASQEDEEGDDARRDRDPEERLRDLREECADVRPEVARRAIVVARLPLAAVAPAQRVLGGLELRRLQHLLDLRFRRLLGRRRRRRGPRQADRRDYRRGHRPETAQPLLEPPQGELDVPALEDRAPVEIEGEAGRDVDRLDDRHRDHVAQAVVEIPAGRLLAAALEEVGELEARRARRWREHGHQQQRGEEYDPLERRGDQRKPAAVPRHAPAERLASLVRCTSGLLLELPHRQRERAPRAEPLDPEEAGEEPRLQDLPPRGQRFADGRWRAEHGAAHDVQHEPVEHRLQPPQRNGRDERLLEEHGVQHHRRREVDGEPHAPHRPPPAARHLAAEVERFPAAARPQLHAQLLKLHARALRAGASRARPPT
jgi:hypothetical protein